MGRSVRIIDSIRTAYDWSQDEADVEVFAGMHRFLHDEAPAFFRRDLGEQNGRLPARLHIFKQAIRQVRGIQQMPVYKSWLSKSVHEIAVIRGGGHALKPESIRYLQAVGDPAVRAVAYLEKLRISEFPGVAQEVTSAPTGNSAARRHRQLDDIGLAYDTFLRSVHSRTEFPSLSAAA